ncbi:hypothetical protein GGR51DRAFT_559522 [Nemania sp. FL0031]|nr:hypothetical protein GGR51DRAFT_559522 [Nemania sp. FL0031]
MFFTAAALGRAFRISGAYVSGATDSNGGNTSRIDFTLLGNNVEVASSLTSSAITSTSATTGNSSRYRIDSSVATALAAGLASQVMTACSALVRAQFERLRGPEQMMKAFRNIGMTEESNYKYIAVWETLERPVQKSKGMPKD